MVAQNKHFKPVIDFANCNEHSSPYSQHLVLFPFLHWKHYYLTIYIYKVWLYCWVILLILMAAAMNPYNTTRKFSHWSYTTFLAFIISKSLSMHTLSYLHLKYTFKKLDKVSKNIRNLQKWFHYLYWGGWGRVGGGECEWLIWSGKKPGFLSYICDTIIIIIYLTSIKHI